MKFYRSHIILGMDTPSLLAGAKGVRDTLEKQLKEKNIVNEIRIVETGSLGYNGVSMIIYPEGIIYTGIKPEDIKELVEEHLIKGRPVKRLMAIESSQKDICAGKQEKLLDGQVRIVLKNAGSIDPENIIEYIAKDGYMALGKVLNENTPKEVIDIVKNSELKGRGGAAFPTGKKWEFTYNTESSQKYVICNADEGEPGTFKDRLIMEGDPHAVIEAMAICAYAIGANKGYIYVRGEYKLSIDRIKKAIKDAEEHNFLGENIFDSDFSFNIEVCLGGGAYVCGEETALIESIEGKRGEPRLKPPYPPVCGLFGKPTIVNNVETLANIPQIILNGSDWFKKLGVKGSAGTKVFTILGDINEKGLIEVPMGISLKEVFENIAKGTRSGKKVKFAHIGGSSGNIVPFNNFDIKLDLNTLASSDLTHGSGVILFVSEDIHINDYLKSVAKFFKHESCGKCTPCREGTFRIYQFMEKLNKKEGKKSDISKMKDLCKVMKNASFCGLGQAAVNPFLDAMTHFEKEMMEGVKEGKK
ncbi:MAG: NADH-quinone oxidoreductase subunit NuoF [Candidatus Muirbacterium halophilum]|nr:NADH-quinone oxidoreductase subunit NuoF [Candidatus Muirbacterium halophilum]MCK9475066.1 NADH-quinone oxidoreductase subunit NuoF [Candidatus Muirbacterium halophilum]